MKSLGIDSKNTVHSVHAASSKYPGKDKDHRSEKYKSKILISEVPTLWNFEDRSQEETERQQRCARSKAWNLAKNMYKLKDKDHATFYSSAEEFVLPAA